MNQEPTAEVLARMDAYLGLWTACNDPRRVFLQCYRAMTSNMLAALEDGFFSDGEWVDRLLHHFADYYFDALYCEECGEVVPAVWHHVYDQSRESKLHPMQLLLMGVNAHINYDLVLALRDMLQSEWSEASNELREMRYSDHMKVNQVIADTIDQVQDEVIEPGHPMMAVLDAMMGRLDEYLLSRLITSWRQEVWTNALAMIGCEQQKRLEVLRMDLETQVIRKGNYIAQF